MNLFTGSGVALVTPFGEDKSVDYEMLGRLIERQVTEKTDAIIVCGTTGEPATLTKEERDRVIRYTVKKVAHRIPVIVGTGSNCTQHAVESAKEAEQLGADGILVVTPYYNKATQKGLFLHYQAVACATKLPIIIYNVPSRTGCNIKPDTNAKLVQEYPNIVGVKEASGDISQVADLARLVGERIAIYSGNDDQILPILSLGGKGVISVLANVVPRETHELVMEYLQGNSQKALELQLKFLPLVRQLFCEVNPIPVKAAMEMIGYPCGMPRLPLTKLEEEHQKSLSQVIEDLNI